MFSFRHGVSAWQKDMKRYKKEQEDKLVSIQGFLDTSSERAEAHVTKVGLCMDPETMKAALANVSNDDDLRKRSNARTELSTVVKKVLPSMVDLQKVHKAPQDLFEAYKKDLISSTQGAEQVLSKLASDFEMDRISLGQASDAQSKNMMTAEAAFEENNIRMIGLHAQLLDVVRTVATQQASEVGKRKAIIGAEIADLEGVHAKYIEAGMTPESSKRLAKVNEDLVECKRQQVAAALQDVDFASLATQMEQVGHALQEAQMPPQPEPESGLKRRRLSFWPF